MKTRNSIFVLLAAAFSLVACDSNYYSDFPKGPERYVYDTIDCSGMDIPAGAITVREALQIGKKIGKNGVTSDFVYIKGIVTSFHSGHEAAMTGPYKNGQFYIQDNTDVAASFYCYHTLGMNGSKFDSLDQLQIGDFIVVKCKITNYNGTIETHASSGSYLVFSTRDEAYPMTEVTYVKDDFAKGLGDWTTQVISGSIGNIWTLTSNINPAFITANSNSVDGESWLISPEFYVNGIHEQPVQLFFSHGYKGSGTSEQAAQYLRAKVRLNGGAWEDLEKCHFTAPSKLGFKTFADSLNITPYAYGTVQVAFAYKSDAAFQPQWKIHNISVRENKRQRNTFN